MKSYTQLTEPQRYQIYALMKAGFNQTETADVLEVHKSTISWELKRNRALRGCRPCQAQRLAQDRREARYQALIPTPPVAAGGSLVAGRMEPGANLGLVAPAGRHTPES